jgi:basic amino acid/polyamine antiporter, APA family
VVADGARHRRHHRFGNFRAYGTAAAGEYFQAPSILHAQALDLIVNFLRTGSTAGALMHGRPPAGPSIAISFFLVAIACSFAGLCYAELASMIPIAGSAYTYSYATLGEIFAWIIGWDLILEYVVSNVAVAVGFAGYTKAQLAAFGINLPDKWASPVWAGGQWTGAYFQPAGLSDRVYSHAAAGARREGIGRDQQHHGGD